MFEHKTSISHEPPMNILIYLCALASSFMNCGTTLVLSTYTTGFAIQPLNGVGVYMGW